MIYYIDLTGPTYVYCAVQTKFLNKILVEPTL